MIFAGLDSESIVERHLQQGEEESIRSELHLGPESDDHNVHIYVRIYDNNNIPVTVHIATVQVRMTITYHFRCRPWFTRIPSGFFAHVK